METYKIKNIEHHDVFFRPEHVVCVVRIFNEVDVILKQNIKLELIAKSEADAIKIKKAIERQVMPLASAIVFKQQEK
ncbi:TPA: hypothetical protein PJF95_004254 [Escherichia coli]|nr:hypothetical protein [Escherichia coli]HBN7235670.1 hypothetical protein [Escherichia coli]HDH7177572.1 hypothetical protein [Escherichia coli]